MFVIVLFDSGMFSLHNLLTLQPMNLQGKVGSEKIHGFHAGLGSSNFSPENHGDNTMGHRNLLQRKITRLPSLSERTVKLRV